VGLDWGVPGPPLGYAQVITNHKTVVHHYNKLLQLCSKFFNVKFTFTMSVDGSLARNFCLGCPKDTKYFSWWLKQWTTATRDEYPTTHQFRTLSPDLWNSLSVWQLT